MKIEIDQSGKIEQTEKNTIMCLSNDHSDSVLIKASTKRKIQEIFRRSGQVRNFIIFTYSAGLFILLKRNKKDGKIYIDQEYLGKEAVIKELISEMSIDYKIFPTLYFSHVGKMSKSHLLAHDIATGKITACKIITFEEIWKEIKKTEVGKRLKNA